MKSITKYNLISKTLIFFFPLISLAQEVKSITAESVPTKNGLISGKYNEEKTVMEFKGIPYAAPPVGDLRWKEPQPIKDWKGVRKCTAFGPNAMQRDPVPFEVYTEEFLIPKESAIGEDCLYLNVWTAAKSTGEKRPVIMFVHGGAFREGSGSVPIYDGGAMAKKGIVFITINYRLGIFGFFAHPELTRESTHHASGNFAILDQIAALKWIKDNIRSFGGDPNNVTVAGQSAGAFSVNALQASPLAKGLFQKVIAESGGMVIQNPLRPMISLDSAEKIGLKLETTIGVKNIKALRKISAAKLLALQEDFRTGTIIDGYVLPASIPALFSRDEYTDVPLLTGYTADEFHIKPISLTEYREKVKGQFRDKAERVLKWYPADSDREAEKAFRNLSQDLRGIQNYAWARIQGKRNTKVYLYLFNRKIPEYGDMDRWGAFHTGEVPYAYNNLEYLDRPLKPGDFKLADVMSDYWANFARTGNPNGKDLPYWPSFNKEEKLTMILDSCSTAKTFPFRKNLEFLLQIEEGSSSNQ